MFTIRTLLPALVAGTALLPLASEAQAQPLTTLKSVSVDLPQGDRAFPPGPGLDAVNNNCLACHSAGMILNQPSMSKTAWDAEVHKMINTYKAPVAAEDVDAIVAYLDAVKGAKPAR
jgi:cytochrome c5